MMKNILTLALIFTFFSVSTLYLESASEKYFKKEEKGDIEENIEALKSDVVRVWVTERGEVVEVSRVEYLTGCLFAQIPPNYHIESLKAQAIVANTYAEKIILLNGITSQSAYDLSDDPSVSSAYFTEEKAKSIYGSDYEKYLTNLKTAAEYAADKLILYDGLPIFAVYTGVSAGKTNTAYSIWGKDYPYLKSINSSFDAEYTHFATSNEKTPEEVRKLLSDFDSTLQMPLDYTKWFEIEKINEAGYTEKIKMGGKSYTGGEVWRIFGLRSMSYNIEFDGTNFVISTRGYGHGAGMSQFGAQRLAERGFSAEEILEFYYSGVNIGEF